MLCFSSSPVSSFLQGWICPEREYEEGKGTSQDRGQRLLTAGPASGQKSPSHREAGADSAACRDRWSLYGVEGPGPRPSHSQGTHTALVGMTLRPGIRGSSHHLSLHPSSRPRPRNALPSDSVQHRAGRPQLRPRPSCPRKVPWPCQPFPKGVEDPSQVQEGGPVAACPTASRQSGHGAHQGVQATVQAAEPMSASPNLRASIGPLGTHPHFTPTSTATSMKPSASVGKDVGRQDMVGT